MIRHFVEAVGDENPVYVDAALALASGRPGIVAPPAMLQAWAMQGLRWKLGGAGTAGETPQDFAFALLGEKGFTSVVATNCEQEYTRDLLLGERLSAYSCIESVSAEKRTALGQGHFVTSRTEYRTEDGATVATMLFRILLYRAQPDASAGDPPAPILTADNAFFFAGLANGQLLIQRCSGCASFRHPPQPRCPACGSFDYDAVPASGEGTLHSFVVVHHPQTPGFAYPLLVGLVETSEGTRVVAPICGIEPGEAEIGMPLSAEIEGGRLRFRHAPARRGPTSASPAAAPARVAARASGPTPGSAGPASSGALVSPGTVLAPLEVQITRTLIVAGAIATRDYQDVHHDAELARANGAPDIFMNILTTNGFVGRYATDWAGPAAVIERIAIRLGAPNYPGDTMRMTGEVTGVEPDGASVRVELAVRGANRLGDHVIGGVRLRLPPAGEP
jgi:uncharacterized OB-fold protein/acyl dehydratase